MYVYAWHVCVRMRVRPSLAASPSLPVRSSERTAKPHTRLTGRGGEGLAARLGIRPYFSTVENFTGAPAPVAPVVPMLQQGLGFD